MVALANRLPPTAAWPSVDRCALTPIPVHAGEAGALCVLESFEAVAFAVRRVFAITGVPAAASRGAHANAITQEFIVCLAGAVTVVVEDARESWSARLDGPHAGLYVPAMCWVELRDFAPGTSLVVLADTPWAEAEGAYYRDHDSWRRAIDQGRFPMPTDAIVEL
jgi:hypothetical protein